MRTYGVWRLYKKSLGDLWHYKWPFFMYQIFSKAITGILLLPIMSIIVNRLMSNKGFGAVTNGTVARFFFSPQGLLAIIVTLLLSIVVILMELGGLIIISANAYYNRPVSILGVFTFSLSKFKNMLGVGSLILLLFFLIISPWLGFNIHTSIISQLSIPGFIMDYIKNNNILDILLKILTVCLFGLGIFLLFSLHFVVLKNQKSFKAIKSSITTVRKNFIHLLRFIIVSLVLNVLTLIVVIALVMFVVYITLTLSSDLSGELFVVTLVSSSFLLFLLGASLILTPLQVHQLTYYYYNLNGGSTEDYVGGWSKGQKAKRKHNLLLLTGAILGVFAAIIIGLSVIVVWSDVYYDMDITAHRGSSMIAPENSLSAIEAAIENGADFVEIDVQETKEGDIVLTHDTNLSRVTGEDVNIYDLTVEQVQQLDAGSWFSSEYAGEKIPTLREVIELTRGKIRLNIELKSHDYSDNLVKNTLAIIKEEGILRSCVVTSLEYDLLQEMESLDYRVRTGYIMYVAIGDLSTINTDFYSIEASSLTDRFVEKAHDIGREVHVWTVNDTKKLEDYLSTGVDNIITDYDADMKKELQSINEFNVFIQEIVSEIF